MKQYQYKIQWLFNNNKGDIKNIKKVLDAIGVRSLTKITFRDHNLKQVASYSRFIQYPSGIAEMETMKAIKNIIKKQPEITAIELYKKD